MSIIQEIRDEIQAAYKEPASRDLTVLALLFLVILSLIGLYTLFWKQSDAGYYWIGAGVVLFLSRVITPFFLRFYKIWLAFGVTLGYFVSRTLLILIFSVVMIPTGLLMRLVGRDPMERKLDPAAPSYWIRKEPELDASIERYQKQF